MTLVTRDRLISLDYQSKHTPSLKYLVNNFVPSAWQKHIDEQIQKPQRTKWIERKLGENYEVYKKAMDLCAKKEQTKEEFIILCEEDCVY